MIPITGENRKNNILYYYFSLAAGVIIFRLIRILGGALIFDDSYITFRYAANIANGHGIVYNIGERVLGSTTPLWTILLSIFRLVGFNIVGSAQFLGVAFDVAICCLLYNLLIVNKRESGLWAAIIWIVYPYSIYAAVGGMETSLFIFLNVLSFYLMLKKNYNPWLRLSAPFALLTRPEGVIIFFINLYDILKNDVKRIKSAVISIIFPAIYVIFTYFYYGSPIPHSLIAKSANQDSSSTITAILSGIFLGDTTVLLPFVPFGLYYILKRGKFLHPLIWSAIYIVSYILATPKMWLWYYLPMELGIILVSAAGIALCIEKISEYAGKRQHAVEKGLTAAAVIFVLLLGFYYDLPPGFGKKNREQMLYEDLAAYIIKHTDSSDAVLASDIGHLGYYTNRTILDIWGLVWKPALDFAGSNAEKVSHIAEKYRPAAVVIPFERDFYRETATSEWFQENYILDTVFAFEYVDINDIDINNIPEKWSTQYLVYFRSD
jgi:hypothetical protein